MVYLIMDSYTYRTENLFDVCTLGRKTSNNWRRIWMPSTGVEIRILSRKEKLPVWISEKRSENEINTNVTSFYWKATIENCFAKFWKFACLRVAEVDVSKSVNWLASKVGKWLWISFDARSKPRFKNKVRCYVIWNDNFKRKKTVKTIFLYAI